jgi:sialic acid synthase SpsE
MKAPMIIAEVAQAHDGSLGQANACIEAFEKCGVLLAEDDAPTADVVIEHVLAEC